MTGTEKKSFILIGAAGYVAPRHMAAIKAVDGDLIAALDPHDSVGILDSYFPSCRYFSEFERLDRWAQSFLSGGGSIDYVSICSPNWLHDAHCRWALRIGAEAICEKPLVINERNLDQLARVEHETGGRVWAVLQLRHNESARRFKAGMVGDLYIARIVYHTPRGAWYRHAWKGDEKRSGGIITNIGIHLLDLCGWFFGEPITCYVNRADEQSIEGVVDFVRGGVAFNLSIRQGCERMRRFEIDGMVLDLSDRFEMLHVETYRAILRGDGLGIEDARPAVRLAEMLREKAETNWIIDRLIQRRGADLVRQKIAGPSM